MHKRSLITSALVFLLLICATSYEYTTVDSINKSSWSGNTGWADWQGDLTHGANFRPHVASGFIWEANTGWINLGDGYPSAGIHYTNSSNTDFGVNVDPDGDPTYYLLSGYAWSPNLGWISFDVAAQTGNTDRPKIDKVTGILQGYAWSANAGWLSLNSSPTAFVDTGLNLVSAANAVATWAQYD